MVNAPIFELANANSVINAVWLASVSVESLEISFTSYPFNLNEPVTSSEPVNSCMSSKESPNWFEPVE